MTLAQIEMHDVSLRYFTLKEETESLCDISFSIEEGEFISIVGPSGCGKSTLLSLISGLLRPTEGHVRLFGETVQGPSDRIGYMLQHDHLFEWRNVWHNLLVGAQIRKLSMPKARQRAQELLKRYGMEEFSEYRPKQLSGGMRQRVALIRTLVLQPDIFLLDEPFSALDYQTRLSLSEEIHRILREQKKTVVLVTHDLTEAIGMADRVLVMSRRPGKIKKEVAISYSGERPSPLQARQTPEFNRYFNQLWKELEAHVRF